MKVQQKSYFSTWQNAPIVRISPSFVCGGALLRRQQLPGHKETPGFQKNNEKKTLKKININSIWADNSQRILSLEKITVQDVLQPQLGGAARGQPAVPWAGRDGAGLC